MSPGIATRLLTVVPGCATVLFLAFAAPLKPSAGSVPDKAAAGLRDRSNEVVREVFRADEFWWKRTQSVDNPDLPWLVRAFRWIGDSISRVLDWVKEFLRWLWEWLDLPETGAAADLSWIVWLLLVVAVVWAVWKWRRIIVQWFVREPVSAPAERQASQETLPDAVVLITRASDALRRGDYAGAVRFAFLALLAWLQNQGVVRYDPSRTNREYYRDLRDSPALARAFLEAATPFERVWYGKRPVDGQEADRVISACRQVIEQQKGRA